MLRLPDHWVWDSWYAHDGAQHHAFFLRASRALIDPDRRHLRASVGHAVSPDLRQWTLQPDALVAADSPAWDDMATWTGSVIRGPGGTWHMYYTGVSRAERGVVQRIGLATSEDLITWTRYGDVPLLEADPRWYEKYDGTAWFDEAWRDPWVFADPRGDGWHMLITARSNEGVPEERGVIGHARSADLLNWESQPPLSKPDGFGQLEVPQVAVVDGQPLLIFCCNPPELSPRLREPRPSGSVWAVAADSITGPFDIGRAQPFPHPSLYAARLVQNDDQWSLIGFRDTENGAFIGELTDPIPVQYLDGGLTAASDTL
ncbi:glycoside hydrolase family protein [Hoyosella subflava]|uniref:Glycosyl hydrolase family 32 domain protein n=1 Tax=Hoyosella subflava (strain DSM 45089 / JCM 17490 / NBRC 109087 / DQS3-9A1) TaxID=443218 RepID=F6EKN2_HOYSD|nr:glycosyl hydrolase family 32 [Hoyosella subflava]AEF40168.1 Glycosyl hydrolase family 32 domain protein [Hoyosella subflava DQS3-9A1]